MKIKFLILLGLVMSIDLFAQDHILYDSKQGGIAMRYWLIVPTENSDNSFIFESYSYMKYSYWMLSKDTLILLDDGVLKGKRINIHIDKFPQKVDKCDSVINKIRNAALNTHLGFKLNNIARKEIGYDNKEFEESLNKQRPTENQENSLCHDEFKPLINQWYETKSAQIFEIKNEKIQRLEIIRRNEGIDKLYIKSFLNDFGACEPDVVASLELMKNHPDEFLTICNELDHTDYYSIKLKISRVADIQLTNEAMKNLIDSPIESKRKKEIIRALKKTSNIIYRDQAWSH